MFLMCAEGPVFDSPERTSWTLSIIPGVGKMRSIILVRRWVTAIRKTAWLKSASVQWSRVVHAAMQRGKLYVATSLAPQR